MGSISTFIRYFSKLRIDRSHGPAPHKPILLLSVLQAVQVGLISSRRIYITPELLTFFKSNWAQLVNSPHQCRFSYPFFHLKSSGFWNLLPTPGNEVYVRQSSKSPSLNELRNAVQFAEIDQELFDLMKSDDSNLLLRQVLLETYFPTTKHSVDKISTGFDLFHEYENALLVADPENYRAEIKALIENNDEEEIFVRGGAFKREIPKIYDYTCSISRLRVTSVYDISIIDACHIKPFAESYDDTIGNGISLCPNLHRAFDRWLITIDKDFKLVVSSQFSETEVPYSIRQYHGKQILLPSNKNYYPRIENLEYHNEKFRG
jgi:putative restriction endonuclease